MRWLILLVCAACAAPQPRVAAQNQPLPFISDDYARALGEARAHQRAIFVETWAPW